MPERQMPRSAEAVRAIATPADALASESPSQKLHRLLMGRWSVVVTEGLGTGLMVDTTHDGVRCADVLSLEDVCAILNGPGWNLALDAACSKIEEGVNRDPRLHLIDELLIGKANAVRAMKRPEGG